MNKVPLLTTFYRKSLYVYHSESRYNISQPTPAFKYSNCLAMLNDPFLSEAGCNYNLNFPERVERVIEKVLGVLEVTALVLTKILAHG